MSEEIIIPLGNKVTCDLCNADYTNSDEQGGFIFGSYAYCPKCAIKGIDDIHKYGEEDHIRDRCPEGTSFADFVRAYRDPHHEIRITTL